MRPGYLAALASRALGVAPVLRPATPSRFEPEGPRPEPREITETRCGRAGPGPAAAPRQVPGRPDEPGPPDEPGRPDETVPDAPPGTGRSLHGFFAADIAGEPRPVQGAQDGWAAPRAAPAGGDPAGAGRRGGAQPATDRAGAWPEADREPAGPAGRSRRRAPLPATAETGLEALASAAALTPDPAGAPSGRASSGMAAAAAPLRGGRATSREGAAQTGRSRQQAQAAGRAGGPEAARSTEPAIVVRIGRVDVRAVQAAPPPAPPPRPRPPAGPSLAEHLRARDRGRR